MCIIALIFDFSQPHSDVCVRYVQLPGDEVDTQLLQDATRKEAAQNKA